MFTSVRTIQIHTKVSENNLISLVWTALWSPTERDPVNILHKLVNLFIVLTNQQFVDHDRKYLASELEKSVSSNHRMSHMQSLLTKEKCLLQEENRDLRQVISEKNLEIEELEKKPQNLK